MLSVVLSTFGNHKVLHRVLDGYDVQDAPAGSWEMIVVADMNEPICRRSTPPSASGSFRRRIIGRRPGLSANRNTGWRAADAPLILFTDNDTIPVPALVSEHLAWHRDNPGARSCGRRSRSVGDRVAHDAVHEVVGPRVCNSTSARSRVSRPAGRISMALMDRSSANSSSVLVTGTSSGCPISTTTLTGPFAREQARAAGAVQPQRDRRITFATTRPWSTGRRRWRGSPKPSACSVRSIPKIPPWFYDMFSDAMTRPPSRGLGVKLVRFVPRSVPWLGPKRVGRGRHLLAADPRPALPRSVGRQRSRPERRRAGGARSRGVHARPPRQQRLGAPRRVRTLAVRGRAPTHRLAADRTGLTLRTATGSVRNEMRPAVVFPVPEQPEFLRPHRRVLARRENDGYGRRPVWARGN